MNLWIRSQNKEMLIPNPKLSLEDIKNEYWIIDLCDDTVLGTYKTKERALEVLDEIQKVIELPEYNMSEFYEQIDLFLKANILNQMTKIYEMPKE